MNKCIFCNINKKDILFENNAFFVILDKNPINKWHCLIISKNHFNNIFDANLNIFKDIWKVISFLITDFKMKYWFENFNILHASWKNAQQSVWHLHIHFIPRYKNYNLNL